MEAHDDLKAEGDEWLAKMVVAAHSFLEKHNIREDPRAAVVWYCRRIRRPTLEGDV